MVLNDKLAAADKHAATGNELARSMHVSVLFLQQQLYSQRSVYVGIIMMVILGCIVKSFIIHHLCTLEIMLGKVSCLCCGVRNGSGTVRGKEGGERRMKEHNVSTPGESECFVSPCQVQ